MDHISAMTHIDLLVDSELTDLISLNRKLTHHDHYDSLPHSLMDLDSIDLLVAIALSHRACFGCQNARRACNSHSVFFFFGPVSTNSLPSSDGDTQLSHPGVPRSTSTKGVNFSLD